MYLTPVQYSIHTLWQLSSNWSWLQFFEGFYQWYLFVIAFERICVCVSLQCTRVFYFGLFFLRVWVLLMSFPIQNHSKKIYAIIFYFCHVNFPRFLFMPIISGREQRRILQCQWNKMAGLEFVSDSISVVHTEGKKEQHEKNLYIIYIIKAIITITWWK